MKLFRCDACGRAVFFENSACEGCGHLLAFLPDEGTMGALEPVPASEGEYVAASSRSKRDSRYRLCSNGIEYGACNWAVPAADPEPRCRACRLNELVPDLSRDADKAAWMAIE